MIHKPRANRISGVRVSSVAAAAGAFAATLLLSLALAATAGAQAPDKTLKNYVKAIGGDKKLKAVTSFRATGEVRDLAGGNSGSFILEMKKPDNLYLEFTGADPSHSEGFNGRSAWEQNGAEPARTLTGAQSSQLRVTASYWIDRFQTYTKAGDRASLLAGETIEGRAVVAIEMATRVGVRRKFLFDSQSGLLVKEIEEGEGAQVEISFSDYRAVDGVLEPFHLEFKFAGKTLDVTLREARHNISLDETAFTFPNNGKTPIPDQSLLLQEIGKNQKELDLVRRKYIYQTDETGLITDSKGKTKENESETHEVFYLGSEEVDRLIAKDGQPLTPGEKKKEDARIDKVYEKYHERQKKEAAAGSGKKEKDAPEEDLGIRNFLVTSSFVNPRFERFHGKEMLVFDFAPRPGFKPKNLQERLIETLAGVVWIDLDAKEIVRLEARSNDNFKVGEGLLVSLQRGMYLVFQQEFVHDEVWLPSYAEIHFSARALLLLRLKGDVKVRFSNYRKFGSEIQIKSVPAENH